MQRSQATCSIFRPYHCADCGKSYKDSASFKRHRLGHTGERPYSCKNCSEAFIDSKALRRHREVVHPAESRNDADLDSVGGDDNDDNESDDDDGEVSVGRDVVGQHVGEVCDDDEEEEEEEEEEPPVKGDPGKNASSTSAYSSFESTEEHGSESS
jgi:DNA-directed RNA polymerase subunit RPC12/RpoP